MNLSGLKFYGCCKLTGIQATSGSALTMLQWSPEVTDMERTETKSTMHMWHCNSLMF